MQASSWYPESRHKIRQTHVYTHASHWFLQILNKEKQAQEHNFHPSPTSPTSWAPYTLGIYSGRKTKRKKCFCTCQTSPIAPGTLSASCSPLPPRGPYHYSMNRKSFAKEWKWSQMNAYWDLWFYILISIKKFLKHLATDSIPHLNIINTYFPPYQGLIHFLGFTYPLAEHS